MEDVLNDSPSSSVVELPAGGLWAASAEKSKPWVSAPCLLALCPVVVVG